MTITPFVMREIPQPTTPLPIACRSVGHYNLLPGWKNRPTYKSFVELFWCIRGEGHFLLGDEKIVLRGGEVLTLFSDRTHDLTAHTHWEFRWMTLDGACPDTVLQGFGMTERPAAVGLCPEHLFDRLSHEIEDSSPKGQLAASATAYEILTLARVQRAAPDPSSVSRCIDLIRRHYAAPEVNVTWLARRLKVHRTNLSKLFQSTMRVSPIEYLALYRVSQAMKLLQSTDLPVTEVATQTGFSSPSYFTNVIRKRTGLSPTEIRSHNGGGAASPEGEVTTKV